MVVDDYIWEKALTRFGIRISASILLAPAQQSELGKSLAQFSLSQGYQNLILCHDSTIEAFKLANSLRPILSNSGANVCMLHELCVSEAAFFTRKRDTLAVYITGSHEAPSACGVKLFASGSQVLGTNLDPLRRFLTNISKNAEFGTSDYFDVLQRFVKKIPGLTKRRVAVSNSSSAGGKALCRVLSDLGHSILELGLLPSKLSDSWGEKYASTWVASQATELTEALQQEKAEIGFVVDEDGDRIVLATPQYGLIPCDEMGAALVKILKQSSIKLDRVVCDFRASPGTRNFIRRQGTQLLISEIGRDAVANCMRGAACNFGFEISGHFFFRISGVIVVDSILAASILASASNLIYHIPAIRASSPLYWRAGEFRIEVQDVQPEKLALDAVIQVPDRKKLKLTHFDSGVICTIPSKAQLAIRISHNSRELSLTVWTIHERLSTQLVDSIKKLVSHTEG